MRKLKGFAFLFIGGAIGGMLIGVGIAILDDELKKSSPSRQFLWGFYDEAARFSEGETS